jgi:acyl-CoA oxidase
MSYVKIPSNLVPSDPQGSDLLALERRKATFDVKELTLALYGSKDLERYNRILKILENDPAFDKSNLYFMGRTELFKHALKKDKRLVQLIKYVFLCYFEFYILLLIKINFFQTKQMEYRRNSNSRVTS